jgi:hypothetical protein
MDVNVSSASKDDHVSSTNMDVDAGSASKHGHVSSASKDDHVSNASKDDHNGTHKEDRIGATKDDRVDDNDDDWMSGFLSDAQEEAANRQNASQGKTTVEDMDDEPSTSSMNRHSTGVTKRRSVSAAVETVKFPRIHVTDADKYVKESKVTFVDLSQRAENIAKVFYKYFFSFHQRCT